MTWQLVTPADQLTELLQLDPFAADPHGGTFVIDGIVYDAWARSGVNTRRPMFELINDHQCIECPSDFGD